MLAAWFGWAATMLRGKLSPGYPPDRPLPPMTFHLCGGLPGPVPWRFLGRKTHEPSGRYLPAAGQGLHGPEGPPDVLGAAAAADRGVGGDDPAVLQQGGRGLAG